MPAAYPTATAAYAIPRARPPSASTAESLVLAGLILQIIGAVGMGILMGALMGFTMMAPYPYWWAGISAAVAIVAVALVFLYLAYEYSYLRIQRGEYIGAQTPTLVIGIVSLFFGLIPGILYLIAYAKLGDALREQMMPPTWYPYAPPAVPLPPPPPPT